VVGAECISLLKKKRIDVTSFLSQVLGAVNGYFNYQLEDCFQKVFQFVIASYLKFLKVKVSNEAQSNKVNRGTSTAGADTVKKFTPSLGIPYLGV